MSSKASLLLAIAGLAASVAALEQQVQGLECGTIAPPPLPADLGATFGGEAEAPKDKLVWLNPNANAFKLSFINCAGQFRTVGGVVKENEKWRGGFKGTPFELCATATDARKQVEAAALADLVGAHPGIVVENPAE